MQRLRHFDRVQFTPADGERVNQKSDAQPDLLSVSVRSVAQGLVRQKKSRAHTSGTVTAHVCSPVYTMPSLIIDQRGPLPSVVVRLWKFSQRDSAGPATHRPQPAGESPT